MRAAAVGGHGDDLEIAALLLDPVGLDQGVDHEGASRLALAIMAVAAMHEHRLRGEPITHRPARAAAFECVGHLVSSR